MHVYSEVSSIEFGGAYLQISKDRITALVLFPKYKSSMLYQFSINLGQRIFFRITNFIVQI